MQTRDVSVGAVRLSVTEEGTGAPIVFLHAFPLSARMWASQLQALPAGWRGVAPDLRGFGQSPRHPQPARHVGDHADDVLALIDANGGPVVLAGLSMGGYIAFECWRRRPSAIRGLVLAGWRLLRCNPWSHGGYDPVEDQRLFPQPPSSPAARPPHA